MSKSGLALAIALLCAACTTHAEGGSTGSSTGAAAGAAGDKGGGGEAASGSLAPAVVGTWFTNHGNTSTTYDPATGSYGDGSGEVLEFVFRADGTYTKEFQDLAATGCTTGFRAFEDGTVTSSDTKLFLHPTSGHIVYVSCSGADDSDRPIDVQDATLTFKSAPFSADPSIDGLTLTDAQGATSEFRKIAP